MKKDFSGVKISVIIPCFNMEKYLNQCLDSITKQTIFKNIELVCVNDGSTDGTLYILRKYEERFNNIFIINQMNMGVGIARNNGMKAASGEFICFMDPDDYYLNNNSLEKLYEKAKENNVNICGGSFSEDHDNGRWIRKSWEGRLSKYTFTQEGLMNFSDYQFEYGYHRFIYNRKFLKDNDIWFPAYIRFQDPPFFIKAMITAKQFYAITDVTYCYRYGHQKLNWDLKRTSDMLMGVIDDLRMSRINNLDYLHNTTAWRLFCEYKNPIMSNLQFDEMKKLLETAKSEINFSVLKVDQKMHDDAKELLGLDLPITEK